MGREGRRFKSCHPDHRHQRIFGASLMQWIELPFAIIGFVIVAVIVGFEIHDMIYGSTNPYDGF